MNEENGENTVKELGDNSRARFWQTDVSDTDSVAAAVEGIVSWTRQTGRQIGGVVAAAGVGLPSKVGWTSTRLEGVRGAPIDVVQAIDRNGTPLSLASFDTVLSINLRGSVDLIRQLLPTITANAPLGSHPSVSSPSQTDPGDGERGVLILVSSVAAYDGQPGQISYSASKGAISSLVLPLARDLAAYGIRAVAVAPGVFESAMTNLMPAKVRRSLEGVQEFPRRMGRPEEFARLVREVVGNVMVNATTIRLDGAVRMPSKM